MHTRVSEDLLYENAGQCNKIATIILGCEALYCAGCYTCFRIGVYGDFLVEAGTVFLSAAIVAALFFVLSLFRKLRQKYMSYLLMFGLLLVAAFLNLVAGAISFGFFIIPLVLSARFYNKRVILHTGVCCLLFFLLSVVFSMYLHNTVPGIQIAHDKLGLPFDSVRRMLLYHVIPEMVILAFVSLISYSVANSGIMLIRKQSQLSASNSAIEQQLATAAHIQRHLLPRSFNVSPNGEIDLYALLEPAKTVSGDFYAYDEREGKLYAAIADVSDKGLSAAMFMMSVRNAVQVIRESDDDLNESVAVVNKLLCEGNSDCMFITALFLVLDYRTGVLHYVNAGHDPFVMMKAEGSIAMTKDSSNTPLGIFTESVYEMHTLVLEPGDMLFLYTDGVTDAQNDAEESYGTERLLNVIPASAQEACETVNADVAKYVGDAPQFDDITMMALRWYGCNSATVPATLEGTSLLLDWVSNYLDRAECDVNIRRMVDVVIDELCANIVDYAYPNGEGTMRLDCKVKDNVLVLTFLDSGVPFNPTLINDPDFENTERFGGLGIYFTRSIADSMEYRRTEDGMNELTIVKSLEPMPESTQ